MSNAEFVIVPIDLLSEVISNLGEWSEGLDTQDQVDFVSEQIDRLTSVMSAGTELSAAHSADVDKMVNGYEIAGYEGSSGLYYSRIAAVANGEQSIEPVYRVKK